MEDNSDFNSFGILYPDNWDDMCRNNSLSRNMSELDELNHSYSNIHKTTLTMQINTLKKDIDMLNDNKIYKIFG